MRESRHVGALAPASLAGWLGGIVALAGDTEKNRASRAGARWRSTDSVTTVLVELSCRLETSPSRGRRGFSAGDGVQAAAA
jgi:hypothetical protein